MISSTELCLSNLWVIYMEGQLEGRPLRKGGLLHVEKGAGCKGGPPLLGGVSWRQVACPMSPVSQLQKYYGIRSS